MRVDATERANPGTEAAKSGAGVAESQQLLNEYFPSAGLAVDGRWSERTSELLRDFQAQRGLPETGRPDDSTLTALRRAVDWIRHERAAAEPSERAPSRTSGASSGRSPVSTQEAMLASRLGQQVPDRVPVGTEFRPIPLEGAAAVAVRLFLEQPHIQGIVRYARDHNKTVVLGGGVDGCAALLRRFGSAGLYIGPRGEVGLTAAAGVGGATQMAGASATAQVTVINGGPENLHGSFGMVGFNGGEALVGGVGLVIDSSTGRVVGASFEAGVGASVIPIEFYGQLGWGTATRPVSAE